ncbi:hypothetical protein NBRC116188_29320 [Oceaniserpentilla sp. 4NH20-0058]|uniref:hypothetical protein n=1 Tax=Oceaniserpentilla sp. 4NH20-0058 TaxID=3127660 RepID=UPI0031068DA3
MNKLFCTLVVLILLSGCASNTVQQAVYLSEPESVDALLSITTLDRLGVEITESAQDDIDPSIQVEFIEAFNGEKIQRDFREYLLINVPNTNIQAWTSEYSSKFQRKITALEGQYKEPDQEPDFKSQVQLVKNNPELQAKLDQLFVLMKLEDEVFVLLKDVLLRPLVYGSAMIENAGKSVDQALLDKKIDEYIAVAIPMAVSAMKDAHYYTYSKLNREELDQLVSYYQTAGAEYFINTITSALGYSLSNAAQTFNELIQEKTKTIIQSARFDSDACLKVHPYHICEVLTLSSLGKKSPLYIGGAVIPKSETYRLMSPNNDWQQVSPNKEYTDDLVLVRKDGKAFITMQLDVNTKVDTQQYAQQHLGEILSQINKEASQFELSKFTKAQQGSLNEICYAYDGVEVCKLAGGREINGNALYVLAFFERQKSIIDEVVNIITSIEEIAGTP